MKFLILDHYFWQDIEALRYAANSHQLWVIPYTVFYSLAQKHFPPPVFGGLEEYLHPRHADARRNYAAEARRLLQTLYLRFPFDAVLSPSDTFFYVRALVTAAHDMGIPFIVLQKETTISPFTMIEDARTIGRTFPFISDLMLVCSERHKQFWLNTGAEAEKIIVTGQPRFDLYRQPERWQTWADLGLRLLSDRPTILFFSYDLGAYLPEVEMMTQTWERLRTETEEVLIDLARQRRYNVLIKPHPQQDIRDDKVRLRAMAGNLWGKCIQMLSGELDARHLIVNAQVIVGFQTTALFEAMAAGKKVVYTFWSEPAFRFAASLIPFHEMGEALYIARSPQELTDLVLSDHGSVVSEEQARHRQQVFEEYLGPLDGHAAERSLKLVETFVADHRGRVDASARSLRQSLNDRAPAHCRRELPRAQLAAIAWRLAEWLLPLEYPVWLVARRLRRGTHRPAATYGEYRKAIAARHRAALECIKHCRAVLAQVGRTVLPGLSQ
jgi:hypothetical protein